MIKTVPAKTVAKVIFQEVLPEFPVAQDWSADFQWTFPSPGSDEEKYRKAKGKTFRYVGGVDRVYSEFGDIVRLEHLCWDDIRYQQNDVRCAIGNFAGEVKGVQY